MTNYNIVIDQKLIVMQMSGEISATDIEDFIRKISVDENFNPSYSSIVDIRGLRTFYSTADSHEIIDSASFILGGVSVRSAVIADSFLRVKMIDIVNLLCLRNNIEIKGFTHLPEACSWLGFDEGVLSPQLLNTVAA